MMDVEWGEWSGVECCVLWEGERGDVEGGLETDEVRTPHMEMGGGLARYVLARLGLIWRGDSLGLWGGYKVR